MTPFCSLKLVYNQLLYSRRIPLCFEVLPSLKVDWEKNELTTIREVSNNYHKKRKKRKKKTLLEKHLMLTDQSHC